MLAMKAEVKVLNEAEARRQGREPESSTTRGQWETNRETLQPRRDGQAPQQTMSNASICTLSNEVSHMFNEILREMNRIRPLVRGSSSSGSSAGLPRGRPNNSDYRDRSGHRHGGPGGPPYCRRN